MVVQEACQCGDLPPHSHVYRVVVDPGYEETSINYVSDPYDVRIWVDWRTVAREFALDQSPKTKPRTVADGAIFWDGRDAEDFEREARWEADHPGGVITPEERASMDSYQGEEI